MENYTCPICINILIEPVTLPCKHELCLSCFQHNVQESLCCPMCRRRISSWVRRQAKVNNLVNQKRWKEIKSLFPEKVRLRQEGFDEDPDIDGAFERPALRLAEPGEIRHEYETAVQRLNEEREAEKRREEEASTALLETLREEDELKNRERQKLEFQVKEDEELARLLESVGTPALRYKEEEESVGDTQNIKTVLDEMQQENEISSNPTGIVPKTPSQVYSVTTTPRLPLHSSLNSVAPSTPSNSASPSLMLENSTSTANNNTDTHQAGILRESTTSSTKLNTISYNIAKSMGANLSPKASGSTNQRTSYKKQLVSIAKKEVRDEISSAQENIKGKTERKILFEKKLNVYKIDKRTNVASPRSKVKYGRKSLSCKSGKLELYFSKKQKSSFEPSLSSGEASKVNEEQDRLFALALQKQYDLELKLSQKVNRSKGTSDEYKLRATNVNNKQISTTNKRKRSSVTSGNATKRSKT